MGAKIIKLFSDSKLVISQIKGEFQAKDLVLIKYLAKVKEMLAQFDSFEVDHVYREQNERADLLAKLASTRPSGSTRSVIEEVIPSPSVILAIEEDDWRTPYIKYLKAGCLPEDHNEAKKMRHKAAHFSLVEDQLFRRGLSNPMLKCVSQLDAKYILEEIHEGSCGHHIGGKSLARKLIRAGYYWPTLLQDATAYVKRCSQCQKHGDLIHVPAEDLHAIVSPWPFHTWGLDILGPFHPAPGQFKFLIVAVDYFTKWVEAEPLTTITSNKAQNFVFRNIICRFGIPSIIITDNGTQFTDKGFRKLLTDLHVKQYFASVEHPQTNGQAEAANKIILKGLKKRCEGSKKMWVENLFQVLWSYRTTCHSSTKETPFRMVYGMDAVIPVEIGSPSQRVEATTSTNHQLILEDLEFIDEIREEANLREMARKQQVAQRYNLKVKYRSFKEDDLVMRRASIGNKNTKEGKLAANWEGPYRVKRTTKTGAYALENLEGKEIPRTFNALDLKFYYS